MKKLPHCQSCKKDFQARLKKAYNAGLELGERRLQHTLDVLRKDNNNLQVGNRLLRQELVRLDKDQPLPFDPFHITITIQTKRLKKIITELRKHRNFYYAKHLKGLMMCHRSKFPQLADEILRELGLID